MRLPYVRVAPVWAVTTHPRRPRVNRDMRSLLKVESLLGLIESFGVTTKIRLKRLTALVYRLGQLSALRAGESFQYNTTLQGPTRAVLAGYINFKFGVFELNSVDSIQYSCPDFDRAAGFGYPLAFVIDSPDVAFTTG